MQTDLDKLAENLVRNEVHLCLSSLISTLAGGHGAFALGDLCEQAAELCAPIDDWEEAAIQAGWDIRHDMHGYYALTCSEAAIEDTGIPSAGFDGRDHFDSIDGAARAICETNNVDPYQWEVYEHWAVAERLGHDLEEIGEKVDFDFAGLVVWARTTTGQAIAADSVMLKVARLVRDRAAGVITPATAARREAEFAAFMSR